MTGLSHAARPGLELLDVRPPVNVLESEYRRLLGYPKHHVPGERADELAAWARHWYGEHGRPWVYLREVELQLANDRLRLDGMEFNSRQLHDHLWQADAERAVLVAVSAGRGCEEHAGQLWRELKPDEYFFLEMFGSAVVEHLVATMSGRICDLAERDGLMAVPHYSPGYTGWDVADQNKLFELITRGMTPALTPQTKPTGETPVPRGMGVPPMSGECGVRAGMTQPFPEPFEVLPSGMPRPKKSLLAVVGLTARTPRAIASAHLVPCQSCSFSPCQYRRAPYRHAAASVSERPLAHARSHPESPTRSPLTRDAKYTVNPRALRKWARERVRIEHREDGSIDACFHFDGTTCSNLGRPLAFDYTVALSAPGDGYTILRADCRPAPGDEGHTHMCAYLSDAASLMNAIGAEKPLLGRPLNDILGWARTMAPSGCHCTADSRVHKWNLALETIHYALVHAEARAVLGSVSHPP